MSSPERRLALRAAGRELLLFLAFAALTAVMTWPWIVRVRDAVPDAGDPYISSWVLWWDFHQTFHDPLRLFHGNVFYPYKYSLAFSEHDYGIALPLFPLFAMGMRPLTAQGVATLLGYTLCGYGAFRLARTLTGSAAAAWIAGIGFAFVPYRVHQISHVVYVYAGWIPLLLEALVLYLRKPTGKRALWLAVAFLMNGLCCVHWLVLTLPPLTATAVLLWLRYRRGPDLPAAARGLAALGGAALALAPFLVPYQRAARLYGFVREAEEARLYSGQLIDWITPDPRMRFWHELGSVPVHAERCLFPGLLLLLLPLAALLLTPRDGSAGAPAAAPRPVPRRLLVLLDVLALLSGTVALLASGEKPFVNVHLFGVTLLRANEPYRALALLAAVLLVRWWIAYPKAFTFCGQPNLRLSLQNGRRPEAIAVGLVWAGMGFLGSFGMNGPFHRILWEFPLFRSIRVPTRWAMVADVGLAVLAGLGAILLARALRRSTRLPEAATLVALALAMLAEQRFARVRLDAGEADPDPLTRRLAVTPMRGGLLELPSGGSRGNYRYMLRAADHGKPLVNGVSGFIPPYVEKLEDLTGRRPIPDSLMNLLERIPVSYVAMHEGSVDPDERGALHAFLWRAMNAGRLRYVNRFGPPGRDDLYAVVKTEPEARTERAYPWLRLQTASGPPGREDASLTGNLDDPSEGAVVRGELVVRGWARVPGEDLAVTVAIDGELRDVPVARVDRPDVAAALPQMGDTRTAGFEAHFPFTPGEAGTHEALVIFRTADGRVRHYPTHRFEWRGE